jgi:hypothetical protein
MHRAIELNHVSYASGMHRAIESNHVSYASGMHRAIELNHVSHAMGATSQTLTVSRFIELLIAPLTVTDSIRSI